MSHNLWEARVTALACEIADSLKLIAPPVEGANIKARIASAARATGLSYWRAWDLWYGKARRIDAHEADAIRTARARRAERQSMTFKPSPSKWRRLRTPCPLSLRVALG